MSGAYIVRGDARSLPLADKSVQCIVTSPPYFGLRSYGGQTSVWDGDPECEHVWDTRPRALQNGGSGTASAKQISNHGTQLAKEPWTQSHCWSCEAWKGELGSEPTPTLFVAHLMEVMAECWRVLRDDGVAFVNLGDSYASHDPGGYRKGEFLNPGGRPPVKGEARNRAGSYRPSGTKPKSLLLVPERFAIALSDAGWIVRSRIAWCKAAPMPESVRDRPTSAWEHIWMLSKQGRYFWCQEAVRETAIHEGRVVKASGLTAKNAVSPDATNDRRTAVGFTTHDTIVSGRNLWNYWVIPPDPYPGAHFATFPREIPRRCIAAASREGDVVLDPFGGSQTVAFVAASMGRVGVGIELSAEYIDQARTNRLAQNFLGL